MKVIGEKLACIDNSRVFIVSDTQKFDQINLSINDISTYQTDKYWMRKEAKGYVLSNGKAQIVLRLLMNLSF